MLRQECCHAGNLRRSHRGAGHILVAAAIHKRIDVAAGSDDLRLHFQGTGNAPGGEAADRIVVAVLNRRLNFGGNNHFTGIVEDIAGGILHRGGVFLDQGSVLLRDRNGRFSFCIGGKVHQQRTRLVVCNDRRNCAVCNSIFSLLREVDLAAVADRNLSGQNILDRSKFFRRADGIQIDILMFARKRRNGHIGVGLAVPSIEIFRIIHLIFGNFNILAGSADVLHGGYAQHIGEGAGCADGCPACAVGIRCADNGFIGPCTGVAGGGYNDKTALDNSLKDLFILCLSTGIAGPRAAEGKVGRICSKDDCVLNGGHIVAWICTAGFTEDLHNQNLCIRGDALRENGIQCACIAVPALDVAVRSSNTGNVRAVISRSIMVMANVQTIIHVVEAIGNLRVNIELLCRDILVFRNHVQLREQPCGILSRHQLGAAVLYGVGKCIRVKRGMVNVRTGVNDGNLSAGAGIAGGPSRDRADHLVGGRHFGIHRLVTIDNTRIIAFLNENLFHAVDLFNFLDLAVFHIGRNNIRCERQVPDNIKLAAVEYLIGDRFFHFLLLILEIPAIAHRSAALRGNIVRSESLFQCGGSIQNNGNTDNFRILIVRSILFIFRVYVILIRQTDVILVIVHLLKRKLLAAFCRYIRALNRQGRQDETECKNKSQQH